MDSCRVKDNHSPWPGQAYPLLSSSQLSSEPVTAPARPQAIWLARYHIHTPSHTHIDTESIPQVNKIHACCEYTIQKFLYGCKMNPSVYLNFKTHLRTATCQKVVALL